jgi:hypothetical protein
VPCVYVHMCERYGSVCPSVRLYVYVCVCMCMCVFVCVCVCMLRALSVNGQDILESQPDGCECVPNVFLMCS